MPTSFRVVVCCAVLVTAPAAAAAGPAPAPDAPRDDSVYSVSPALDGTLIGVGIVGSAVPYALAPSIVDRRCPCDPGEVNGFDRWVIGYRSELADVVSTVTVGLAIAAPLLLGRLDVRSNATWLEDATVLIEALAINGALVSITKVVSQRPLPRVYAGDLELAASGRGYDSFYSGHAVLAFSALSTGAYTYGLRHGHRVWPWLVVVGVGGSVALERLAAGQHFPTDVIVGAAVGTAVGILVPALHRRLPVGNITLLPLGDGLGVSGRF